jgi:hypothetical protein
MAWALPGIDQNQIFAASVTDATQNNSAPAEASFRLSFELKTPRRFASRFRKATRTLEVRVSPAQAKEFDSSTFYDTRFVHRLVIREEAGEVILGLQLRNTGLGWLVTYQENPWRLVVDIWRTEGSSEKSLEEQWQWQEDLAGESKPTQESSPKTSRGEPDKALAAIGARAAIATIALPLPSKRREALPANYGRLEEIIEMSNERIQELQRKSGESMGTADEFSRSNDLAAALYLSGRSDAASTVYRRLASISETKFRENPENIWRAGESAYLTSRWDLARDYYRTLTALYPDIEIASQARLRLADVDYVTAGETGSEKTRLDAIASTYTDIALSEKSSFRAKIAASLRVLQNQIDRNPGSAKLYQQTISACVNKAIVPIEMRKNCSYIETRSVIENVDLNSADREVQEFKRFSTNDPRSEQLELRLAERVRSFLTECKQKKTWDTWIEFERNARPSLLDSTRKNPELLFARAEAWESAGETKSAAKIYGILMDSNADAQQKDDASALAALAIRKSGSSSASEKYLTKLSKSSERKKNGLSQKAVSAARTLSLAPYRSTSALPLVLAEMRSAKFVERELPALLTYAKMTKANSDIDLVYEKILAHPAANADETKAIEGALFQYGENLSHSGRNEKAAEILASLAGIQGATRRAEAAYKAGIAYARSGKLEKAKTNWQLAAGDVSDKRFSTLANERLERIR